MPTPNDPIQPAAFDVPAPQQVPEQTHGDKRSHPSWLYPALGALLVLALVVVFWLPAAVDNSTTETPPTPAAADQSGASQAPTAEVTPTAEEPAASPWSDAQAAKLRREAQDVLAELLELQFDLQSRGAEHWAATRYAQAVTAAQRGDEQYREREFGPAKASYQHALDQLLQVEAELPAALQQQLVATTTALENLEQDAASTALTLATQIDPQAPELARLQPRVAQLPQLIALHQQAEQALAQNDLAGAVALLEQAVALDPDHAGSAAALAARRADHLAQQFNTAMSEGYSALDQQQFAAARKAFARAAKLKPGSAEAASAQAELTSAETAAKLATLKRQGHGHQQAERWQQAVSSYEQALAIDGTVAFARSGLEVARPRLALHRQLQQVLAEPHRLADIAVAQDSEALLAQARTAQPRGPVLQQQIEQLQALLERANTTVDVTLRSDGLTEVIVYKVARLGQFDQRQLTLRPGRYTAVGSRNGYRDVRVTFTVDPDQAAPLPVIICRDKF